MKFKTNYSVKQKAIRNLTLVGQQLKNTTAKEVVLYSVWEKESFKGYIKIDTKDLINLSNKKRIKKGF